MENAEHKREGERPIPLPAYLVSAPFQSSLFENWESEFLQMGLFVLLTVPLRQKGSSESRKMDPAEDAAKTYPASLQPWPVRRGGTWLKVYEHSLALSLLAKRVSGGVRHCCVVDLPARKGFAVLGCPLPA